MDLKQISVTIEADGFRLDAKGSGLTPDTALTVWYEHASGWAARDVLFEPEPPSLFHPFRKSMFIYTGEPARRVVVGLKDGGFTAGFASGPQEDREVWVRDTYYSYPDFDDAGWQGSDYPFFASGGGSDLPTVGTAPSFDSIGSPAESAADPMAGAASAPDPAIELEAPEPVSREANGSDTSDPAPESADGSAAEAPEPNAY